MIDEKSGRSYGNLQEINEFRNNIRTINENNADDTCIIITLSFAEGTRFYIPHFKLHIYTLMSVANFEIFLFSFSRPKIAKRICNVCYRKSIFDFTPAIHNLF